MPAISYSAYTIAKWFVAWAEAEDADLSNLKLQKLLYYAQGHHLAQHGAPLFVDDLQAWSHGPVVPSVYRQYKGFGSGDLRLDDADPFRFEQVDPATADFLVMIWNTYGGFAAWRLRNMTHDEPPWREHFRPDTTHIVIPKAAIKAHFDRLPRG